MWSYAQKTGIVRHDGAIEAVGYSGNGIWKDLPAAQDIKDHGPIPRGRYRLAELTQQHPRLGHYVIRLEPHPENEMFGRDGFCWHGDNPGHLGQSSDGCIVTGLDVRMRAWGGLDHEMEVAE